MGFTNVRDLYFASNIPIDRILGTYEDSFSVGAPTSGTGITRASTTFSTLIPESTFFQGIFSVNSGVTWNDFNTQVSNKIVVFGRSNANSFTVSADNYYDYDSGSGTAYTIQFKVALVAKADQGDITPQPIGASISFNSNFNYQKIYSDTTTSLSIPNLTNDRTTVTHDLGYIPKVRSFIESSSTFAGLAAGMYETSFFARETFSAGPSASAGVEATSGICFVGNSVYTDLNNQSGSGDFTGTLYTRIYYDA